MNVILFYCTFARNSVENPLKIASILHFNNVVVSTLRRRLKTAKRMNITINRTRFAIVIGVLMAVGVLAPLFTFSDGFESLNFMALRLSCRRLRNWVMRSAGSSRR